MARRRYNDYYQPEVVDPGAINFGSIQMYNPEDVYRMAQVGQGMQQRWDMSQGVIAKQLEDIGAANINPRYKADVINKLEGDIENIYKDVNTTYQGDFGRALSDITKSIGKSRALLHSATQATAEESKQRDIYNQMAAAGKAPVIYKRDAKGNPTPTVMTFDEYHGIDKQPSFVEGRFNAPTFNTLRSAGEYEPYIERMVGHLMKQSSEQGLSKDPKYNAFLRQVKTIGQDPVALRKLFDTNQPEAQAMVEDFIRNNPTVTQEFVDESGKLDMNLAKDFLADALVARVKKSIDYNYMQNPDYKHSPVNPIIHPYDTIVKPGNKNEKISSIVDRFNSFRKNSQYVTGIKNVKTKREELAPKIDIKNVSNVLKPLGLAQFTTNALTSIFNDGRNINSNAVQGILETYSEFYPEKAEEYLDKDSSGKYSFKTSINARGLVANDFIELVNEKPFERVDKYTKEQNEYFSKNHGLLKQVFDEGKITQEELFNLAEQSEREKALTFDVGIIPKDDKAIEEINDMARFISSKAIVVNESSGEERSSKKTVWEEITERGGINRWTYNPLDGTIDYWTKNGGVVRTDINKNGTKVVKEISNIISSTIDSYYKNDTNLTEIPLPISYTNDQGKNEKLKIKIIKEFDPATRSIRRIMGMEELQQDRNGDYYIGFRKIEPDAFISQMFAQIELFKGERIQQKSKDPNKQ